ncbi:MAG TPA: hypothetical protein VHO07_03740 [Streptosporangiaceae bacterium]|jgi:hypothetical protein|nr:hypothetical protein [Streptosporangiaceae bacterium]
MMFARDLLGSASQIAEALYAHAGFREVTEVAFALPFSFAREDLRPDPVRHGREARAGPGLAARRGPLTGPASADEDLAAGASRPQLRIS